MKITKRWLFSIATLYLLATSGLASAGDILVRWDSNIEPDLQEYYLYCGTQSRSYTLPIPVGKTTEHLLSDLDPGKTYFFAITAVDNAGNESAYSSETSVTIPEPDKQAPIIAIATPTMEEAFRTTSGTLNLGGTAADNRELNSVRWSASDNRSGAASGTNSWSTGSIQLQEGITTFTVTATDAAGNQGQDTIAVSYTAPDTTSPAVVISSPTSDDRYTSDKAAINLAGSASDNVAVSQVTWSSSTGQSGKATGTDSWSIANMALSEGDNTITITAVDTAGNTAVDVLRVTYTSEFTLSVYAYKDTGKKLANLTWKGGSTAFVDVYRNGGLIPEATGTPNDGQYTHGPFSSGKPATYKICEDGTSHCSNEVTVSW